MFDPIGIRTHDLQIMTVHSMSLRCVTIRFEPRSVNLGVRSTSVQVVLKTKHIARFLHHKQHFGLHMLANINSSILKHKYPSNASVHECHWFNSNARGICLECAVTGTKNYHSATEVICPSPQSLCMCVSAKCIPQPMLCQSYLQCRVQNIFELDLTQMYMNYLFLPRFLSCKINHFRIWFHLCAILP